MDKKNIKKLFTAAAAVGAAAAAAAGAAVVVKHTRQKKSAEEMRRLPKGRNIYFLGNSMSALFAAAYLIQDFGFKGDTIHIFGKYAISGCGNNEDGFSYYADPVITAKNSECLFEILQNVPSRDIRDISVKTEIENYNNAYPLAEDGRIYGLEEEPLSYADKKSLIRFIRNSVFEDTSLDKLFTPSFFGSDFFTMWSSMFNLDRNSSAAEFKKLLNEMLLFTPEVETCAGLFDTPINKFESIYEPLKAYLAECGVEFCDNITVTDIDFDETNTNVTSFHIIDKGTMKTFYLNSGDLCFMTPCTIFEGASSGDFDNPAPMYEAEKNKLWKQLYNKKDDIGNPDSLAEAPIITFTVTLKDDALLTKIFSETLNSPGTLLTIQDSKWDMSIVCPMSKFFAEQRDGVYIITGKILNCEADGEFIEKPAIHCSGSEILYELVGQLGLEDEWEEIRDTVINVIPVLLPFGKSAALAQNTKRLSASFPNGSRNFIMIGAFAESGKAFGDMEYYAANAKQAVYECFNKKPSANVKKVLFIGRKLHKRIY